jgi:hypothetical protein
MDAEIQGHQHRQRNDRQRAGHNLRQDAAVRVTCSKERVGKLAARANQAVRAGLGLIAEGAEELWRAQAGEGVVVRVALKVTDAIEVAGQRVALNH